MPGVGLRHNASVSKKIKMPPIDNDKVAQRLARASSEQLLVSVRRWIPDADRIDGFVVGVGSEWVAVAKVGSAIRLDGWCFVRLADVQSVYIEPDPECFEVRALKARGEWPPKAALADLDSPRALIESVAQTAPMVSLHAEFDRPDICWEGAVTSINEATVDLLEISTRAVWYTETRPVDLDDITRVEVGGGYEEALILVAGPPPAR